VLEKQVDGDDQTSGEVHFRSYDVGHPWQVGFPLDLLRAFFGLASTIRLDRASQPAIGDTPGCCGQV
jgi:hypothetical protein